MTTYLSIATKSFQSIWKQKHTTRIYSIGLSVSSNQTTHKHNLFLNVLHNLGLEVGIFFFFWGFSFLRLNLFFYILWALMCTRLKSNLTANETNWFYLPYAKNWFHTLNYQQLSWNRLFITHLTQSWSNSLIFWLILYICLK